MCVCVCVCVCVCMYVCIYIYMCVCVQLCIYIYIHSLHGRDRRPVRLLGALQPFPARHWPLRDIVINNIVLCIKYKRGLVGGLNVAQ